MKVKVTFEGETKHPLTYGQGTNIQVHCVNEQGPFVLVVPKSWCTTVCVDEPVVHGPYKLRNEDGIFYAYKRRYSSYWEIFGSTSNYTWEDFGNVIEVEKLESDEGAL